MVDDFTIVPTADGSDTLYSASLDESYHSRNGAIQESMHVFIQAGLRDRKLDSLRIFEVGFGTGLNALLTWQEAEEKSIHVYYEAIETYPLLPSMYEHLRFERESPLLPPNALHQLHQCEWGIVTHLSPFFSICKHEADFTTFQFGSAFDVVYYDAFSPDKQPELWTDSLFQKVYHALNPNGLLVTYCAKGAVRRSMQQAGFQTERLPGPPGKREMLRASRGDHLK